MFAPMSECYGALDSEHRMCCRCGHVLHVSAYWIDKRKGVPRHTCKACQLKQNNENYARRQVYARRTKMIRDAAAMLAAKAKGE